MALWGNNDNVTSAGTVSLNYGTGVVTGNASCKFGDAGSAQEGDVIRFTKAGVYFGDAVIKSIASNTSLTIGSTNGLSGAAISASGFTITQLPKYTIGDPSFREANPDGTDEYVFAVGDATIDTGTAYETGAGWVGVQTYMDTNGSLRVKKEILVAMSGITTGNAPIYPSNPPSN
jgi:hypothetical protein|tara:strand:+ start:1006 stop:1530 length:525 start_codon:yes stop_codon:yes gene_type:complete